jgi:hypothetical protein
MKTIRIGEKILCMMGLEFKKHAGFHQLFSTIISLHKKWARGGHSINISQNHFCCIVHTLLALILTYLERTLLLQS